MIDKKSSAWAPVSRAVRTPDVFDYYGHSIDLPMQPGVPVFPVQTPNPNIISETLLAYELGYRVQATDRFSWDLALFYNHYDSLVAYRRALGWSCHSADLLSHPGRQRRGRRHLWLRVVLSMADFRSLETAWLLRVSGNADPHGPRFGAGGN